VRILAATTNRGKIAEIRRILANLPVVVVSPADLNLSLDVPENGSTFMENALAKAMAYMQASGLPSLADDSGLCVEALGLRPGVLSARFAGPLATDRDNYELLLDLMKNVTDRRAFFECAVALAWDGDTVITATGRCDGFILTAPRGGGGFGYDPVFLEPRSQKTFAELDEDAKNSVSHRGRALAALAREIRNRGLL